MSITHGFGGFTSIGAARVLCRRGARFSMPRNWFIPHPVSYQQYGPLNYCDGLRFPVLQLPAIPMDMGAVTDSPWFTSANLNAWFLTRSSAPTWDLAAISSGITFSDNGVVSGAGLGSFNITAPKGQRLTLAVRKGQDLGVNMSFAGVDRTDAGISAPSGGLEGTPVNFGRVTFGGSLASKGIIAATLSLDTGLTSNMALDGTLRPSEQNADLMTATLTIEMNAQSGTDAPGFVAPSGTGDPAYTEVSGTIIIVRQKAAGMNPLVTMTVTMPRMILQDPDDRQQGEGRMIRSFTYNCLATTSGFPVGIAEV